MAPEPLWSAACELTLSFLLGTFIFFIGLVQTEKEHNPKLQQLLHLKNMTVCSKNQTSSCNPLFLKLMSRFQFLE